MPVAEFGKVHIIRLATVLFLILCLFFLAQDQINDSVRVLPEPVGLESSMLPIPPGKISYEDGRRFLNSFDLSVDQ